MTDDILLFC